jgi:hypothetical protein
MDAKSSRYFTRTNWLRTASEANRIGLIQAAVHIDRLRFSANLKSLRNRLFKFVIVFGVVVAFPSIALLYLSSSDTPAPAMPNPNGLDEIERDGTAVATNFMGFDKMSEAQLRTLLKTYATAIARGHDALKLQCRMRPQWIVYTNSVGQGIAVMQLSQAFIAEGRLAEIENRAQDAVKCYVDTARLGNQAVQGGLVSDGLIGISVESRGSDHLQKLSAKLNAKSCAEIVKALELLDFQRQPLRAFEKEEDKWYHHVMPGVRGTLTRYFVQWSYGEYGDSRHKAEKTYAKLQAKIRQNIITIASRTYKLDKGFDPRNISDLVPDYLTAVPTDPSTGRAMTLPP